MIKAVAVTFAALVMFVIGGWLFNFGKAKPAPHVKHQVVKAWDGNPDHPDCSENGHPDPKHPGDFISDRFTAACEE